MHTYVSEKHTAPIFYLVPHNYWYTSTLPRKPQYKSYQPYELVKFETNQCFNSSTVSILVIPDDENRYSSQNLGLFTVQPPDTAGSPRVFYYIQIALNLYGRVKFLSSLYTICKHHTMKHKC
jgi:hypothetical protein